MALKLNNYKSANFGTISAEAYVRLLLVNTGYADLQNLQAHIEVGVYDSLEARQEGLNCLDVYQFNISNTPAQLPDGTTDETTADSILNAVPEQPNTLSPRDAMWQAVYNWLKTRQEFAGAVDVLESGQTIEVI